MMMEAIEMGRFDGKTVSRREAMKDIRLIAHGPIRIIRVIENPRSQSRIFVYEKEI